MTKIFFVLVLAGTTFSASAQKEERKLHEKLEALADKFNGQVGIYVHHLRSGSIVDIKADSIFPTASMIKIAIAVGVFDKIEKGELNYHQELIYRDSLLYPGVDILGSFRNGEKIELSKVVMLMLTMSDNTASLWCQLLAGSGLTINELLSKSGYFSTRVNSRTPGREAAREKFGWGQTSPREMARLVTQLYDGKMVSPRASERIYRTLSRNYWDGQGLSEIPPYIQLASKNGAVDESRSEVVLVQGPHGPYVYCVITRNQQDHSWGADNEGFMLLRNVSKILWEYFEPQDKWTPSKGIDEWR